MPDILTKSDEQIVAEANVDGFRRDLGPFVVAAQDTRMPMIFTDAKSPGNPLIFANKAFLQLTGYDRDHLLGRPFHFLIAHGMDPEALTWADAGFGEGAAAASEDCYRRRNGTDFWAATLVSPVRDAADQIVQHFVSFVDLTRHKEELRHSNMLIDELNHRVKNTLATVQSIVRQALQKETDPVAARKSIESRLFALSRSHDLLAAAIWKGAGLRNIVEVALEPFGLVSGDPERIVVRGGNIDLPPKATLALGIALHELATNAIKYGALSNDAGSLLVEWAVEPAVTGDRIVLHWRESGGPLVEPPLHRGFGSQVIEHGLAHELEGLVDLDFAPTGVVVTIDIPAPGGLP